MSLLRKKPPAILVLEDGSVYHGYAFASSGETLGEVVPLVPHLNALLNNQSISVKETTGHTGS